MPLRQTYNPRGDIGANEVKQSSAEVNRYTEALTHEIALHGRLFNSDRLVTKIDFGGGNPRFLSVSQITDILDQIASQFHLDMPGNVDMGIELHKSATAAEDIGKLASLGFNRFSVSADFSPLNKSNNKNIVIDAQQAEKNTLVAVTQAMETSPAVSIELAISDIEPTLDSFEASLRKITATGISRILTDNISHIKRHASNRKRTASNSLPLAKSRLALVQLARKVLLDTGYRHIGLGVFTLPDDPLCIAQKNNCLQRNMQGYTTHGATDFVGFGIGAISRFDTAIAQNETSLSIYSSLIATNCLPIARGLELTGDDRLRANVIEQILCQHSVDLSQRISAFVDYNNRMTMNEYLEPEMRRLVDFINDGLVVPTKQGFDITESGRYFLRSIAAIFDHYLNPRDSRESGNVVPIK